jgi:hypothetical protein
MEIPYGVEPWLLSSYYMIADCVSKEKLNLSCKIMKRSRFLGGFAWFLYVDKSNHLGFYILFYIDNHKVGVKHNLVQAEATASLGEATVDVEGLFLQSVL